MHKQKEWIVFRFDDGRIRQFRRECTYEICKSNGVLAGTETHLVEVPHVEGEARRRVD
jgi:hypothetical protein